MSGGRLHHVALAAAWAAAVEGRVPYRTSTFGRSLDEEGFTHCARAHQVAGVLRRFYAEVDEPLVLLEIDPARLSSPVVDEVLPGSPEAFPHVYGPIEVAAVVRAVPVPTDGDGRPVPPPGLSAGSGPSVPSS